MSSMTVIKIPPPFPSKKKAVAGGTRPSLASVTVMGRSRASADNPRQVANVKGMQNLHSQRVSHMQVSMLFSECLMNTSNWPISRACDTTTNKVSCGLS